MRRSTIFKKLVNTGRLPKNSILVSAAIAATAARTALDRYGEIEAARPLIEEEKKERTEALQKLAQWSR